MKRVTYQIIEGKSLRFFALLSFLGMAVLVGLFAVYNMEHYGHHITGMNNQIVWGMPHVFAIFLIIAASGALNVASIGTVFGKTIYKPLGRYSSVLAMTLLVGGLAVLMLDLGRPDRLVIAMTYINLKSVFAWNVVLYSGFIGIVAVYLWFMMQGSMNKYYPKAGIAAFIWRLILTTGTGVIFGFIAARQSYDSALLPPMFVIMSFSFGLATFLLVLITTYNWTKRELGEAIITRLKNLLGVFVASVLYFTIVYHLVNIYSAQSYEFTKFILVDGGVYTMLFWGGHVLMGSLVPLVLLYNPIFSRSQSSVVLAAILVILGALCQLYVIIIGGQAFPMEIFAGYEVTSSFFDSGIHSYSPSAWEVMLGVSGIAITLIATIVVARFLPLLPKSLANADVDPHAK
jgi:molybdopterin-containing oxidoreductase family membrane subunit